MLHIKEALRSPRFAANYARMLRSGNPGFAICIVEGADDRIHFECVLNSGRCRVVATGGWKTVVDTLSILESEEFDGVLAIIDADARHYLATPSSSANLFVSDHHDIEIDLIDSPAFDKVVSNVCESLQDRMSTAQIRNRIYYAASHLGYLRILSLQANLSLNFKGLTYSDFVSKETLEVNELAMVRAVMNRSMRHDLDEKKLIDEVRALRLPGHDLRKICRGHDVTGIFSVGLRKLFARQQSRDTSAERIEELLRMAHELADFVTTALFAALQGWEQRNLPYQVLR